MHMKYFGNIHLIPLPNSSQAHPVPQKSVLRGLKWALETWDPAHTWVGREEEAI